MSKSDVLKVDKKKSRQEKRKIDSIMLRKSEGLSKEALLARKAVLKTIRESYDPLSPILDQLTSLLSSQHVKALGLKIENPTDD